MNQINQQNTDQKTQQLVVIGDAQTVSFFKLVGAVGFEVESANGKQLSEALQFIRKNARSIGGMLVAAQVAEAIIERLDRMQGVDVPVIRLPDPTGLSQIGFLEALMEKAIGMKLEHSSIFGKK
jgi:vacuolar-type H+-ATPase subunit F/Vma7